MLRAGAADLLLMTTGPRLTRLTRLPLKFLDPFAGLRLRGLDTRFGWQCYRAGFVARVSEEVLVPFRLLERTVRDTTLKRHSRQFARLFNAILLFMLDLPEYRQQQTKRRLNRYNRVPFWEAKYRARPTRHRPATLRIQTRVPDRPSLALPSANHVVCGLFALRSG